MLLVENQKVCTNLNFFHYMVLSLPNIKYFVPKIAIQFNNTPLVVEQNNYATKIASAYIVYDLDNWPKVSLRIFTLKNCLFGVTATVKHSHK